MGNPLPTDCQQVIPYLIVKDIEAELQFIRQAFGGLEREVVRDEQGVGTHGEITIGDSLIMMGRAREDYPPMPCMLYLYVEDTDATYKKALAAGGTSLMEPQDQFYGDRNAGVKDSSGIQWWIATRKENLSTEEIQRRSLKKEKG